MRTTVFLPVATALFVAGILTDVLFTGPRFRELARLREQQAALIAEAPGLASTAREREHLADVLKVDELTDLLDGAGAGDPLPYVSELLDGAGLGRLELSTTETGNSAQLRYRRFTVRVQGSYREIVRFVQALERSPRLATVDAFSVEDVEGQEKLEGRFNISVFDPQARPTR